MSNTHAELNESGVEGSPLEINGVDESLNRGGVEVESNVGLQRGSQASQFGGRPRQQSGFNIAMEIANKF